MNHSDLKEDPKVPEVSIMVRDLHMSPHKVRRVIGPIRGRSYEETVILLQFMPYRACPIILHLIDSAVATAASSYNSSKANFFISKMKVDEGRMSKRVRIKAQGRISIIHKLTCHLTIVLEYRPVRV